MLILKLNLDDRVAIGDHGVEVVLLRVMGNRAKVGVKAERRVPVRRLDRMGNVIGDAPGRPVTACGGTEGQRDKGTEGRSEEEHRA